MGPPQSLHYPWLEWVPKWESVGATLNVSQQKALRENRVPWASFEGALWKEHPGLERT